MVEKSYEQQLMEEILSSGKCTSAIECKDMQNVNSVRKRIHRLKEAFINGDEKKGIIMPMPEARGINVDVEKGVLTGGDRGFFVTLSMSRLVPVTRVRGTLVTEDRRREIDGR